ncbi:MAG: CapA family protein [Candidatus Omnitrophica bacterium]|nr:CapA family protein [Candidatus Omnitrophota bacterium]
MDFRSLARAMSIATPYNLRESIGWVIRNITGPGRKNTRIVESIPCSYVLNEGVKPEHEATFVGDIMPTFRRHVKFGPDVMEFVRGSDFLVGNFSGTITNRQKGFLNLSLDQRHVPDIRDMLARFFPPEKTYLSVCNNHMGDFDNKTFLNSVSMLEAYGFKVFGWNKRPYADVNKNIRILIGTMWSNRDCDYVCKLEDAESHIKHDAFNFLYPHIGYELEANPRAEIIRLGKDLIRTFDAVIGDHSHWPQQVTSESVGGINKLLAYSLGDFCGGLQLKKYQYGIILKTQIGRDARKRQLVCKVEWRITKFSPTSNSEVVVDIIKEEKEVGSTCKLT